MTAERERDRLERRFEMMVRRSPHGVYQSTMDGRFSMVNSALVRMLGYGSNEELLGVSSIEELYADPSQRALVLTHIRSVGEFTDQEVQWLRKDGSVATLLLSGLVVSEGGDPIGCDVFVEDVTEKRALEQQLRQSQKMEAVGQLAGGIAHDFNNILTVILGESELLLRRFPEGEPARESIIGIRDAGRQAAHLTKQLLAFSRKQLSAPSPFILDEMVAGMSQMLTPLLGETIEVEMRLEAGDSRVLADRVEIEQILVNLVVNARDAMGGGGRVSVSTSCVSLTKTFVNTHPGSREGEYLLLSVADSGVGMDEETVRHVFEPFFTTKERGKGTGLGLSMVYGIVKKAQGYVEVRSEIGVGTELLVYLPRTGKEAQALAVAEPPPPGGDETILIAEDEDQVRRVASTILRGHGYTVIEVSDGLAALQVVKDRMSRIDLLLTDVVMPGLGGLDLAEQSQAARPELCVVFMTGYTSEDIWEARAQRRKASLVHKPFTPDTLGSTVRRVLDERDDGSFGGRRLAPQEGPGRLGAQSGSRVVGGRSGST